MNLLSRDSLFELKKFFFYSPLQKVEDMFVCAVIKIVLGSNIFQTKQL